VESSEREVFRLKWVASSDFFEQVGKYFSVFRGDTRREQREFDQSKMVYAKQDASFILGSPRAFRLSKAPY
jgi:hypothetical protein